MSWPFRISFEQIFWTLQLVRSQLVRTRIIRTSLYGVQGSNKRTRFKLDTEYCISDFRFEYPVSLYLSLILRRGVQYVVTKVFSLITTGRGNCRVLNFPPTTFSRFRLNWHGHFNFHYCFVVLLIFTIIHCSMFLYLFQC